MPSDRWMGQILGGRYRIEALIGQGGMSAVYRARDLNLQRAVAIKLIHPHLSDNEEFVRRFASEATAIALLRHPNIVEAYDLNHDGEQYYMVLEFIEGETLQSRIKRANAGGHHLLIRDTLGYFIEICRAADYAHQRGMIHRDIKPANVMLDVNGHAFLMDFGIARILGGEKHTATGVVLGTALYMSPEQIQGLHPDARSDIYSIGISLFEALGGRPPFEADSAMTLMRMHLYDPVPDITQLHPGIPAAVRAIVNRALEKNPADRFQSCAELAAALEQALASVAVEESPTPLVQPPAEPAPAPETQIEAPATFIEESPPESQIPPEEIPAETAAAGEPTAAAESIPAAQPAAIRRPRKWLPWAAAAVLLAGLLGGAFFLFRPPAPADATPTPRVPIVAPATAAVEKTSPPTATARAAAPLPTALPREVLKIAILVPLAEPLGVTTLEGVQMAIDEWNERGGVLEKQIVPVVLDSKCEPDAAMAAARQAIEQEQVHYILGEVCTDASLAIAEIANTGGVVMVSPSATNPIVTTTPDGEVRPYVFRACFTDPFQGVVAAHFAAENLAVRSAFILSNPDDPFKRGLIEAFITTFTQMGGRIAGEGSYTAADGDFTAVLQKVIEARPEIIYLPDDYPLVNRMIRQAREMGIDLPFLGGGGWDSPQLDAVAASGSYFVKDFFPGDPHPAVQRFVEAFGARYQEEGRARIPDELAALGYDATNLLLQGILEAGVDDPARVKDTLAGISFYGVTGTLSFDPQHNPIKSAVIMAVREGKIVFETVVNP